MADPDFVQTTLRGYYRRRDEVFAGLKQRLPFLADAKLSNEAGFEEDDQINGNYRRNFPEKQKSESGLRT